jgi:probable phosphomutase (TIGR03848 family)
VTLVLLIRHALTAVTGKRLSGAQPGIHLSEEGRRQASELAERLGPLRLKALYASPLERCVETAEAIGGTRGLPVISVPDLQEVGYGRWTGRSFGQISKSPLWKRLHEQPSAVRFPEGETLGETQRRAVTAIDAIAAANPDAIVAVVTHADVIRLSVAHYSGVHLDLYQRIIVSPASVSAVLLGDRLPRLVRLNDTGTMADLQARQRPPRARSASRRSADGPGARRERGRPDA